MEILKALSMIFLTTLVYKNRETLVKILKLLLQREEFKSFIAKLKILALDVFLFFFTATWLLMASFPYGCLLFHRWSVICYLKVRYGPLGSLVDGLDAIGTVDSPNCRQIIKALKVIKGECDIEELKEKCQATVSRKDTETGNLVYPKFYQYLDQYLGYYCWLPSNFDINHHVRFYDHCDLNLEESVSEEEVMQLISKNANEPFEIGRANWEILVIPKFHYNSEETIEGNKRCQKFALIIRISHGIGDGFSLMKLIMRDMAGEVGNCIPIPKAKETSWFHKILVFLYVFCTSPRGFYSEMMLKDVNPLHDDKTQLQGSKEILWSDPIRVDWLKNAKNSIGSSMNALLLGALSGACRRYMVEERETLEENIPEKISALIPMPAANHPDNKMCNKFSAIMFPLESKSADPVDRCKAIDNQCRIAATSPDAPVNLFLMNLIGVAPVKMCKYFINNTQTTVVVSNLPGPTHSIKIWGKELLDTMFWLPTVGESGISVSFLSYKTHLRIGITVDTGIIPEGTAGAQKLLDWMIDDFKSIAKVVDEPKEDYIIDVLEDNYIEKVSDKLEEGEIVSTEFIQDVPDAETIVSPEPLPDILDKSTIEMFAQEDTSDVITEKIKFSFEDSVVKSRHGFVSQEQP